MALNPYQSYNNASVMTASPGELTLMLYNGAIRFLKQAKTAIEQEDASQAHHFMTKGQDIIRELMATLKPEYEIGANLFNLYEFMLRHLLQATLKKDPAMVQDVIELCEELRNTWGEALKLTRTQNPAVVANK